VIPLRTGVPLSGQSVKAKEWIYYTITTSQGQGLVVQVNQTSSNMDADLYMLRNALPSLTSYEEFNNGLSQSFQIVVDNAKSGIWYLGIYGYTDSSYTIRGTISGTECPALNNCNSPNGVCVGPNLCNCTAPYTGDDCSQVGTKIVPNTPISTTVSRSTWQYYYLDIQAGTNLATIIVNQTRANDDVDLYVRYNAIPTSEQWDYRDYTAKKDYSISIAQITQGRWWIGMFGFTATSYTIRVSIGEQCPNMCSKHGTCAGVSCNCHSGFTGDQCQNMTNPLQLRTAVTGYVGGASWNYYYFQATTISTLAVNITQSGTTGDCDLYARSGAVPTLTQFDYFDNGLTKQYTLSIPDPGSAVWYFGVFGFTPCDYAILVDITNSCPGTPPCSGHGVCAGGVCSCGAGYSGADCSSRSTSITNGAVISDSLTRNTWKYYTIDTSSTTFLAVDLKELNSLGAIWVFVSKNTPPDIRIHDYADMDTNSALHSLDIVFSNPQTQRWIIGVYGNPYAPNGILSFKVTAWFPPF
jgi:hypothetical protein